MKKLLVFLSLIFMVCGCTANYEITIRDNKISEKITLIETNSAIFDVVNDTGWTLRESFEALSEGDEFSKNLYSYKSLNTDNQLGIEASSNSVEDLSSSSIINQCYTEPLITEKDGVVSVYTGYDFQCYRFYDNLESVKVTLKTNHKVISNNADEVKKGTYVWNLTKDGDKLIEFSYDANNAGFNFMPYIVLLVILVLVIGVIYFIVNKNKKNNEF